MSKPSGKGSAPQPNGDLHASNMGEPGEDHAASRIHHRAIQAIALGWLLAAVSLAQFAVSFAVDAQPTGITTLLAVAVAALGAGFIAWGRVLERRNRGRS